MASACGGVAVTGGENAGSGGADNGGSAGSSSTSAAAGTGGASSSTTIGTSVTVGTGWGVGGTGGATSSTGGAAGSTGDPCPVSQPANGSSRANQGQVCNYSFCGSATGISYQCVAGLWSLRPSPSCNPPPPPLPCPATEPTAGSGCSAFQYQSKTCSYPGTCCGMPWGQATYECALASNQWRKIGPDGGAVDAAACYESLDSCPSQLPVEGSPCCFRGGGFCNYCGRFPSGYASCSGNRWQITGKGGGVPDAGWGEEQ